MIGSHLLRLLLDSPRYGKVKILVRKQLPLKHPKLEQQVVDFNHIGAESSLIAADDIYCCLGTTIRNAGSKEAFTRVDLTYPVELAKATAAPGSQFLVVSSIGANAGASNFYLNTKGKMEEAVGRSEFDSIHIFRPSMLLGKREEWRSGEYVAKHLMRWLSFLFIGPLKPYKPIHAQAVATAMLTAASQQKPGIHIHASQEIETEARQLEKIV